MSVLNLAFVREVQKQSKGHNFVKNSAAINFYQQFELLIMINNIRYSEKKLLVKERIVKLSTFLYKTVSVVAAEDINNN